MEKEHKQQVKDDIFKKLKDAKQQLDEILTNKAEENLRYEDRKYYEMGNKASRLLAFQLRKTQSTHIVSKIRNPDTNCIETQPEEISNAFAKYYKGLYKGEAQEQQKEKSTKFLSALKLTKLSNNKTRAPHQ